MPESPKEKVALDSDRLATYFHQGICQEIDGAGSWLGIDNQVAAFAKFEPVRRVVAEIVIGQPRIFIGLADVHRNPFAVSEELRPTVVSVNTTIVALRGDGGTDGKTSRNANLSSQRDEVGVKI